MEKRFVPLFRKIIVMAMSFTLICGMLYIDDIEAYAGDDEYTIEIVEVPKEEVDTGSEYTVKVKITNTGTMEMDLSGYYLDWGYEKEETMDLEGILLPGQEKMLNIVSEVPKGYWGETYENSILIREKAGDFYKEWAEYTIQVSEKGKPIEVIFKPLFDINSMKKGNPQPFSLSIANLSDKTIDELKIYMELTQDSEGGGIGTSSVIAYGILDGVDYPTLGETEIWTNLYDLKAGETFTSTGTITIPLDAEICNDDPDYTQNLSIYVSNVGEWGIGTEMQVKISDLVDVEKENQSISAGNIVKTVGDAPFAINAKLTSGNGKLSYKSSNSKVATIAQDGKVTIRGAGTTNITITSSETAEYKETSKSIVLTVKPKEIKVSSIKIAGISKKIAAGKKIKLSASVSPVNATNKGVTWKSSNTKVAKVDQNGKVTMQKKSGGKKVTITATAKDGSGKKATYKLTSMKGTVKKVSISGKKTVKVGKSLKLKAKVSASKGANKKLKWTSSNTKYAKVTSSGKIKTYKAGKGKKVKITVAATDGSNKKKSITIKIK